MSKPAFEDIFTFSGRRNRKSYIIYTLTIFILMLVVSAIIVALSAATGGLGIVLFVLVLPLMISSWAVASQRCRDFGWTGWAVLLGLIPYAGLIFYIALMVVPGTQGENRYGPDPLTGEEAPAGSAA
ncbi:MAG: DUF805 domain-containing protein [Rhodobacteraceae bacterium]|nr:DUF805 domain-containing protein [Paracoccaceae bacterium]